ncbi:helicase-related protein, partial [Streptomyces rubiginosohelvolus]
MSNTSGPHAEHYAVREELVDQLRRDLMGPGAPDEILTQDPPITAYPIGVLFPRPANPEAEEARSDDEAETEGLDDAPLLRGSRDVEESAPDLGSTGSGDRRPSSMGITFAVDPSVASSIVVHTEAARYDPIDPEGRATSAKRAEARSTSDQREHWRRRALDLAPLTIDVTVPKLHRTPLGEGAGVEVFVRPAAAGTVTITVTLVNTETVSERELQDAYCLYQPRLTVTTPSGARAFVERPAGRRADDPEVATSRLLHRHAPTFAMGHGCAAEWDWSPPAIGEPNHERAAITAVRTQFLPAQEVLLTDSNPDIDDSALTMHGLATRPESEVLAALNKLMADYAEWIDRREVEADTFRGTSYETPARERIEQCRDALARMRRGIRVLGENS